MEAKATLEKHVALKYNDNLNYYKTKSNVIDEDRQYGCRFHV